MRFPRTRGDGPGADRGVGRDGWVSPHTRGWTRWDAAVTGASAGFPAHAGMDPRRCSGSFSARRFPRTRGDGPVWRMLRELTEAVSPHTRGWTRRIHRISLSVAGFPAHAGMDPRRRPRPGGRPRFPRTRGDGPAGGVRGGLRGGVSPHTRGWTRHPKVVREPGQGFPAHAGMDPRRCSPPRPRRGFPRTRGDGPWVSDTPKSPCSVSPHTRGWTPSIGPPQPAPTGFPAHAGMDPY